MIAKHNRAQAVRARIEDFGPMPSLQRQIVTIALAAVGMIFISAAMVQFGLM